MADVITFDSAAYGRLTARLRELIDISTVRAFTPDETAEMRELTDAADTEYERYMATRQ